ncbi:hypothetical protein [Mycobacterium sp. NAZ190054]|uniref:hypothetical protein n=1 Tax=Mycobacterium sp. NAZ190054 TaxID=1747766 RepID=UPI00079B363B|nr:hypothetical protein [Mycobacterium sp. NAZ190054]KWX67122.1 hypothetical protein ASJ79_22835 [Mycobacterium sp. NAZ190054]
MKHWGEFVVVENGDWQAYDWHWASRRILDMLIGGPELALRHIASFRRSDERDFYGVIPGSGGAVIDLDRNRLLFCGDELMDRVPTRRVLLPALATVWAGFQVGWAYGGTRELAGYVGEDCPPTDLAPEPLINLVTSRYWPCQVISVVGADGSVRFWPVSEYWYPEAYGPSLLDALPGRGRARVALKVLPTGGVHIDPGLKSVGVWRTRDVAAMLDAEPAIWPGWHVEFWEDRYEEQVARCGDGLRVPPWDLRAEIDEVRDSMRQRIFGSDWESPAAEVVELLAVLRRLAPDFAVRDDEVVAGMIRPSRQQWERFLAACGSAEEASAA